MNAQHATTTQWCKARNCPNDAEPSGLCTRHQRLKQAGATIELHTIEQPATLEPELSCCTCQKWLPDTEFHHKGHPTNNRRGRTHECRNCSNARRRAKRNGPNREAVLIHEAAIQREYRARKTTP